MLFDILGPEIATYDKVKKSNPPGVVTGLAWTPVGGIFYLSKVLLCQERRLILTGQMGEVMRVC